MARKVIAVEFPKPERPYIALDVMDAYPLPWLVGEEHECKTDIITRRGKFTITAPFGRPGDLARRICDVFNAFGGQAKD